MAPSTAAAVTGKRKRDDVPSKRNGAKKPANGTALSGQQKKTAAARSDVGTGPVKKQNAGRESKATAVITDDHDDSSHLYVQIVVGSYERVLHGFSASIPRHLLQTAPTLGKTKDDVAFSDTFLLAAHASSVRCLAVSPPTESDKRFLATGSSDDRINVYSVSTVPPTTNGRPALPSLAANVVVENPRNRSLGSLTHHDRAITRLDFPAKGKLFSAAEDNTVAISRTRDWTMLSSIKAPIPKAQGRPSGDTAGPGETPAGVNDFAIHPSQKLMLSVGRGERSLRLWNLMTGKKAGVLNFDRSLLAQAGEGKFGSGEGRRVLWNTAGDAYVVGFERGAAVFGLDSKPKAVIRPSPPTKLHQSRVLHLGSEDVFAVSTEDGRILFYTLAFPDAETTTEKLPLCTCVAQLGGQAAEISGRIKDFEILPIGKGDERTLLVVTASSDGAVRLWSMPDTIKTAKSASEIANEQTEGVDSSPVQVGSLVGTLETGSRITCLGAFVMDGKVSGDAASKDDNVVIDVSEESEERD